MNRSYNCGVAIVGAGFSGTLVSAHLMRRASSTLAVALIERSARQLGRGVAYSTTMDCHLLNVPAGNMSAFPDDPEHFLRWAKAREKSVVNPPWVTGVTATSFLPRRVYGDYLCGLLDEAERGAKSGVRLERKVDEAVGLTLIPQGVSLRLASGDCLQTRRVVLALGNFPPGHPAVADPTFYQSPRYHGNPWASELLATLLMTESCLLIGSGLTMVDWAIALNEAGYRGTIHVVSRRGLWPKAHRPADPLAFGIDPDASPPAVRAWLQRIRQYIRSLGCDWRAVIDALRPTNQKLWDALSPPEQQRFLRHVRPYWDCHRHRLAPVVAERLQALVESGQLVRHVGRIVACQEDGSGVEVMIRDRGLDRIRPLFVDAVVNCSGSQSDYRKLDSPLVSDILAQHLGCPDPLSLGFNVDPTGALLDGDGKPSPYLFTLGPPQKGIFWETTAVPEIRVQAARLAMVLVEHEEKQGLVAG